MSSPRVATLRKRRKKAILAEQKAISARLFVEWQLRCAVRKERG
jgi:hypothetical protein